MDKYEMLRMKAIGNYQDRMKQAEEYENGRTDFQKMDLSPLMALADSETGSNLSRTYKRPLNDGEIADRQANRYKHLMSMAGNPNKGLSADDRFKLLDMKFRNQQEQIDRKNKHKENLQSNKFSHQNKMSEKDHERRLERQKYSFDYKDRNNANNYDRQLDNSLATEEFKQAHRASENDKDRQNRIDVANLKSENKRKENRNKTEKLNQNNFKAGGFAIRAEQAERDLTKILNNGFDPTAFTSSTLNEFIPESLEPKEYKQYKQARDNFITAILRKESGAVISDSEYDREEQKYFPRVGDDEETLRQKAQARQSAYLTLKAEAGGAYDKIRAGHKPQVNSIDQKIDIFMSKNNIQNREEAERILKEKGIL